MSTEPVPEKKNMLMRIAKALAGRKVTETCVMYGDAGTSHLWGLQDGQTMIVRQQGNRFTSIEERNDPIAIVANSLKH